MEERFNSVPSGLNFQREADFALQVLRGNDFLAKMEQTSIMQAVYNVALTGLTLNPVLRMAYLVPFKGKCVLMPSYIGLIKVLTDAGGVRNIICELVYEGDDLTITKGTTPEIHHVNRWQSDKVIGCYAVAFFPGGGYQFEFMTTDQINSIKARSASVQSGKSSPWDSDWGEMARKTVIRRLYKYLPKGKITPQVERVIELDEEQAEVVTDARPKAKQAVMDAIEEAEPLVMVVEEGGRK
jgi:recombination protein RecT